MTVKNFIALLIAFWQGQKIGPVEVSPTEVLLKGEQKHKYCRWCNPNLGLLKQKERVYFQGKECEPNKFCSKTCEREWQDNHD